MGKSSLSSKKIKHTRDSSKLRSVKKKKTKRSKSKKIRRLKDYSNENDSSGSDSSLYSSSEDDYRRKKLGSKVSKKKSRKRNSSTDSDDSDANDDTRLLRKKKKSKRKEELVGKKKKRKIGSRKRRKRDLSSSSTSSESGSVRDSQSDDGSESDAKRKTRRLGKVKAEQRRSKDESEEDCEPDECWQVEDEVVREKNSRRLKSIIVVSYTYGNDERKEDMVHDYDDESDGKKILDDERYSEATISYPVTGADEIGCKTVGYNELVEDMKSETSKSSRPENKLKDDDLEAILKKRALENLKRFRVETQKSGIESKEVLSDSVGKPLQTETAKAQESQDHGLMEQRSWKGAAGSKELETLQAVHVKESGIVLADTAKVKVSSGISSGTTKRKLIRPVLEQERLAHRKEAVSLQDAEAESINGSTIDKNCRESSLALPTENGCENMESTKVSSTFNAQSSSVADTETLDETKGGSQSEEKKMEETKDESQYEQKTMTVMRGGEMVQVSYKVYIPKKTSSLGRRQLKR